MKNYLVDVPVMICIWARPEIQKKTFEVVKKARPSRLFLISDGGRSKEEHALILQSRRIVEDIDWDCKIDKLYYETNQGMYRMISEELKFVFDRVDRCIILEDDILVSKEFFGFCAELLEKYKNDQRITAINGSNPLGVYDNNNADYFFSWANSISGYAIWKRTVDLFDDKCFEAEDLANLLGNESKFSQNQLIRNVNRQYLYYKKQRNHGGHPPAVEFYRSFINVTQNQVDIVPTRNMVSNLGDYMGTNVGNIKLLPKRVQNLFNQKIYDVNLPLKHPQYVMRDMQYEKMMFVSKKQRAVDLIETVFYHLIYRSPKDNLKRFLFRIFKESKRS